MHIPSMKLKYFEKQANAEIGISVCDSPWFQESQSIRKPVVQKKIKGRGAFLKRTLQIHFRWSEWEIDILIQAVTSQQTHTHLSHA